MVAIPQDIIYYIIEAVSDDRRSLRECALVSTSFLLPCRKHLFSKLQVSLNGYHDHGPYGICQLEPGEKLERLHQLLVENPVLQSFVKSITIEPRNRSFEWNCTPLIAILRLPFCSLESFSIHPGPMKWNDFSNELKDTILTIIHSSTIKTLCVEHALVPIVLFLGLNLTKLELTTYWPNEFVGKQSRLLTLAASDSDSEGVATTTTASHTVVDHCKCNFFGPVEGTRFPTSGYFSLI